MISSEIVINWILQTVGMPQVNAVPQQGSFGASGNAGRGCGQRSVIDSNSAAEQPVATCPPSMQRGQIDDPKLSAALRTLELTVKRKLDGVLHGGSLLA